MYWIQVQSASGLTIAMFMFPHLFNTALAAVVGESGYEAFQLQARRIYQHPVVETMIFGAIATHVVAAIARKARASNQQLEAAMKNVQPNGATTTNKKTDATPKDVTSAAVATTAKPSLAQQLFEYGGWILTIVIGVHTFATRFQFPESIRVGWLGNVFLLHDVWAIFIPYYVTFSAAGVIHGCMGTRKALGHFRVGRSIRSSVIFPKGTVAKALVVTALVGVVGGILAMAGLVPWIPVDVPASRAWPFSKLTAKNFGWA